MIPITLISGYLGAGKTTLINQLLASDLGLRLAVLVNDFGDINIDAARIRTQSDDVIELAGGCVCCRLSGGFAQALSDLRDRSPAISHILVETSGVASPSALADLIPMIDGVRLSLTAVLADALNVEHRLLDRYVGEVVRAQLQAADLVILTKTDAIPPDAAEACLKTLARDFPGSTILAASFGDLASHLLFQPEKAAKRRLRCEPPATDAHDLFESFTLSFAGAVDIERLAAALARPELGLQRAKGLALDHHLGLVNLDVVDTNWLITPQVHDPEPTLGVVVIARRNSGAADYITSLRDLD